MNHIVGGIPAPNPDYPQQIKNVTGNSNVKIQNKNLIPFTNNQEFTLSGVKFKTINGKLILNGTSTSGISSRDNKFKENFTFELDAGVYYLETFSDDNTLIMVVNPETNENFRQRRGSFTLTKKQKVYIGIYIAANITFDNYEAQYQVEQGSTATSYVPHQERNLPFTFSEGQRGMQGTTLEDDGIHQKRKQIVLDGSKNWQYYQNNIFYCILNIPNIIRNTIAVNCLSDSYIAVNSSSSASDFETLSTNYDYSINTHTTQNLIRIKDKRFTDVADLKSALTLKPVTVEYKLASEEIIPYNETQQAQYNAIKQARSYDDQTNITSTSNELGFIMDVECLRKKEN